MIAVARASDFNYQPLPGRRSADPFARCSAAREHGVSVRLVQLDADANRRLHTHPHAAETIYVAAGSGIAWCDAEQQPVTAGDVMMVPPNTPHATLPDPGTSMLLVCFFAHPNLAANLIELDRRPTRRAGP